MERRGTEWVLPWAILEPKSCAPPGPASQMSLVEGGSPSFKIKSPSNTLSSPDTLSMAIQNVLTASQLVLPMMLTQRWPQFEELGEI